MPTPVKQRKMTANLLLGVRLDLSDKLTLLTLSDVDLGAKVEKLREATATRAAVAKDSFDLIYCGSLLKNDSTLQSYGLKHGSMIHVMAKRPLSPEKKEEKPLRNAQNAFSSFVNNPLLEIAVRRMAKKTEVVDKIIAQTPDLQKDAVAIAILQDPDLVTYFGDPETAESLAKEHPALVKAADLIVKAVNEEAQNFAASSRHLSMNSSSASSSQWSTMENLSDDDEMAGDSSQSSDSPQAQQPGGPRTYPAISAAHVLHAITRARRSAAAAAAMSSMTGGGSSSASGPTAGPSSGLQTNGGGIITAEMFNQAIENAFASVPALSNVGLAAPAAAAAAAAASSLSTPTSTTTPTFASSGSTAGAAATANNSSNGGDNSLASSSVSSVQNLQQQITLMNEMGLHDDAINLQALQVTNGDVQAAIELVLNALTDN
ncbi:ubiquitin-like protein 7 [Trichogramma pretiosum]|uniref:ubiquitin-like protein 7 n=1 Tax=Trichogramma pretiosum TaxID=7493 RepID=UPI0006C96473|nr:ubiquitin-like protein 7 [Trichogramma pretiosum]